MSALTTALAVPEHLNPEDVAIRMAGTKDDPLFCLVDVCRVLGIGNSGDVARRLDDDEKMTIDNIDGHSGQRGGAQFHTFITEGGLFTVLLTSRVEKARPFRKWVTNEVLPSIARHGCYPPPAGGTVVPAQTPWSQRLSSSFEQHLRFINCHCPGSWSVLTAISTAMMVMEDVLIEHLIPINRKDLPDGSVGRRWSDHRKAMGRPEPQRFAPLYLPDRKRTVDVKIYPGSEWEEFSTWLNLEYMPQHLASYFTDKWSGAVGVLPPASAADNACRRYCNREAILPIAIRLALDEAPDGIIRAKPQLPGNGTSGNIGA